MDKLRGEFRNKEAELIGPILNKYSQVEQKMEILRLEFFKRMKE